MAQPPLTPDEQNLIARAAILAAATVAISKYSGRGGQNKEFDAMLSTYQSAARQYPDNPVVQTLGLPIIEQEANRLKQQYQTDPKQSVYQEFKMVALNRCAQVASLLQDKAEPADAALYKQIVLDACQIVATASSEGGFMGMGGTQVDAKESGVIGEVRRALRAEN